jgi:uncharacterized tellurite resistance protein B-like protein
MPSPFIIFGTRAVKSTIKESSFHCLQCERETHFRHRKARKFFTLYFIPLIPLNSLGEYVECTTCRGTFVPRVLEYDPNASQNAFQSEYDKAIRHSMLLMMLADGHVDEEEMLVVQKIINKFGHSDMTLDELEAFVEQVSLQKEPMSTYLARVAPALNAHGKEMIIKYALAIAAADGHIDESEQAMIAEMAVILEMSNAHLNGIYASMAEEKDTSFSEN